MTYQRNGDGWEWSSRTPARPAEHLRCGMDVRVHRHAGHWMVVGFEGAQVVCVGVDVPGERIVVPALGVHPFTFDPSPVERLAEREVA